MKAAFIAMGILAGSAIAASALSIDELDANGDGGLTFAEISSAHPEVTEAMFAEADVDADGLINAAELATAQEMGLLPADQG